MIPITPTITAAARAGRAAVRMRRRRMRRAGCDGCAVKNLVGSRKAFAMS